MSTKRLDVDAFVEHREYSRRVVDVDSVRQLTTPPLLCCGVRGRAEIRKIGPTFDAATGMDGERCDP